MKFFLLALAIWMPASIVLGAVNERTFERTLNVSGAVNLDVVTDAGGIKVIAGSPGVVRVRGIMKAQNWFFGGNAEDHIRALESNPPVEQSGNTIRAGYVSDRSLLRGVSLRFEIEVPVQTSVRAKADSGGVHVEGVRGPVDCKTDSGGIEVRDIESEVRAQADSGGVHIRHVSGQVWARADSGGIEAFDIAGSIDAQTDSGGIRMSQTVAASVHAEADSGGASLKLARNGGYDIRASSGSGGVSVSDITVHGSISNKKVEGSVRGGGALVKIHTDSGQVVID
ncbi:MAG TPA: DUF4097 family beta strand repeat-containing protein [Bryobacteraceae bacterium]|nr:DUF4097 family beta strand repeat-containing protein [Bryobacteraceae bacterium]